MSGVPTRHPLPLSPVAFQFRRDRGHETSIEWSGRCFGPGYCCAGLGANKRCTNDAIAQRALSDIGADEIDGFAYAEPSGKGTPSRGASREGERPFQRQHCQSAECAGTRAQRRRSRASASNGRCARASLWRPKKRVRPAEPDLRHSWGWATICRHAGTGSKVDKT
jgi:hypothetical protein